MFGVHNIEIPLQVNKSFAYYDGLDTSFIQDQFPEKIHFFNNKVRKEKFAAGLPKNGTITAYYIHRGGLTAEKVFNVKTGSYY